MKTLAAIIRSARKKLGLQVKQLAERVGVDETYITHIEKAERIPSLEVLLKIEKELGVDCQSYYLRERYPKLRGHTLVVGKMGHGKTAVLDAIVNVSFIRQDTSAMKEATLVLTKVYPSEAENKILINRVAKSIKALRAVNAMVR